MSQKDLKKAIEDTNLRLHEQSAELLSIPNVITAKGPQTPEQQRRDLERLRKEMEEHQNKLIRDSEDRLKDRQRKAIESGKQLLEIDAANRERLQQDQYQSAIEKENQLYQKQQENLKKNYATQDEIDLARLAHENQLAEIEKQHQNKLFEEQRKNYEQFISSFRKISSILGTGLGDAGDKFLRDLNNAIELVTEIKKIIESIKTASNFFSFFSSLLGIGAGLATGGAAAGLSGPISEGVLGKTSIGRNFPGPTSLVQPNIQVVLVGTMEGQQFLRKHMPGYRRFERKENI
jgi:hypothetical protein